MSFGRLRPVCSKCGRTHFEDPKVAAGVLVEKEGTVLLVQRALDPELGRWTLPAGFVDAGEDVRQAAARECLEETGLDVEVGDVLEVFSGREHAQGADIVIVFRAIVRGGDVRPGDDAQAAAFFRPGDVPPLAFEATRRSIVLWQAVGA